MRRLLIAVFAAALVLLAAAAPAQAHSQLLGSSPAKGEELKQPPKIVALKFSQQVLEIGALVQVTGPSGRVEDGKPKLAGAAVVQQLEPGLPAGVYQVVWRVTSPDGHPIEGTFSFTAENAGKAVGADPSSSASSGSSSAPAPTEQVTTVPIQPVAGTGSTGTGSTGTGSTDSPSTGWTIAGIAIVLAGLAAGLVALTRPRRRAGAATNSRPPDPDSPGPGPSAPPSD